MPCRVKILFLTQSRFSWFYSVLDADFGPLKAGPFSHKIA
jgi:hypothetical protein